MAECITCGLEAPEELTKQINSGCVFDTYEWYLNGVLVQCPDCFDRARRND